MMKKNGKILNHTYKKILKRDLMTSQRLIVKFYKEDMNNFNCALFFNTVFTL
jgi:hypothetical protein